MLEELQEPAPEEPEPTPQGKRKRSKQVDLSSPGWDFDTRPLPEGWLVGMTKFIEFSEVQGRRTQWACTVLGPGRSGPRVLWEDGSWSYLKEETQFVEWQECLQLNCRLKLKYM